MRVIYQVLYTGGLIGAILSLRCGSERWFIISIILTGFWLLCWAYQVQRDRVKMARTGNVMITFKMDDNAVSDLINLSNVCRMHYDELSHRLFIYYNGEPDDNPTVYYIPSKEGAEKLITHFRDLGNGIEKEFN
jgi:hypothetical protein